MQAPQMTLGAALRDVTAARQAAREAAVANLAPALLMELGRPAPAWRAADDHARGAEVRDALTGCVNDDNSPASRRGMAAIGLGTLGDPSVLELVDGWMADDGDTPDVVFLRECALIGISFVGAAAPEHAPVRDRVLQQIRRAMTSRHPDVRFQAAIALVEVAGNACEDELVEALSHEDHNAVRDNLVAAISRLDPPGAATCEALEALLQGEDGRETIGFEAAMTLADARRPSARPRLLEALAVRPHRDRALEALAALGPASASDCDAVLAIAQRWWLPGVTRVRAAYALIQMLGPTRNAAAIAMLERFAWHPRAAVREAVVDARRALETLKDA